MILAALFALPILGALGCYAAGGRPARALAQVTALATLVLAIGLATSGQKPELLLQWLPAVGINLELRLDDLNVFMILLTPLLTALALAATPESLERPGEYCGHMLLMSGCLTGLFLAQNLGLFYIFWEAMLLPALLIAARWGGPEGRQAALKFLLYTLFGSLPMLLGLLFLSYQAGEPNLSFRVLQGALGEETQRYIFFLFFLGFAVKVPMWPLHGWLPGLYGSLPAPTVAVVAGVMSKAGVYGFLKVCTVVAPAALAAFSTPLSILALITLLYGAVCALGAPTLRGILAFSSLSHLGMIMLGVFSLTPTGQAGALLQMLNHGICTGGLFLVLGALEDRQLPGELSQLGGLGQFMPRLSALFLFLVLASLGLPGLCSFAGEVTILIAVFRAQPARALWACVGIVLAAWYLLRMYQGAMSGPVRREISNCDAQPLELVALLPLIILCVWIGFFPGHWLEFARAFAWS